jgi:hypothetical protein
VQQALIKRHVLQSILGARVLSLCLFSTFWSLSLYVGGGYCLHIKELNGVQNISKNTSTMLTRATPRFNYNLDNLAGDASQLAHPDEVAFHGAEVEQDDRAVTELQNAVSLVN